MKTSIRNKLIVFISCNVAFTILFCIFLNTAFLGWFYKDRKKTALRDTFTKVALQITDIEDSELSDEQKETLDRLKLSEGLEVYLFADVEIQTDFGTLYYTKVIYPQSATIADSDRTQSMDPPGTREGNRELMRMIEAYSYYLFPRKGNTITNIETVEEGPGYKIMSQHDNMVDSDYMDIYGPLESGYVCMVRVPLVSITEATLIANRFLYMTGTLMVFLAIIVAYVIGSGFTKPIVELSGIAKRMSNLDFDAKYNVTTEDEIGELGKSMNSLSRTLETTISELKSANIKLESDIKQKEEIDQMRTEFISNVTHELKTPIALIQGYAEGLKDNINDDAESREFYCDVIMDEASKMNTMVKNLLSLSKIESGGMPLEIVRFNLTDVIRSVISSVDILLKKNEITLDFDESIAAYVWADEYMTEEVVTNYISNAIHHAAGEKIIRIRQVRENDTVRLSVFNTGSTIPEEDMEKLWVKFYKADKARTREYGGTGIGLSIVKAVMDAHHRAYGAVNHEDGVEFYAEFDGSDR